MESCFSVYENEKEEFDITFEIRTGLSDSIPNDQKELYENAEATCNVIKALEKTDKQTKRKYFDKLLKLCQVGLVLDPAQTEVARSSLEKLKEEIVLVEGKRIKNSYLATLGRYALVITMIFIAVGAIAHHIGCTLLVCICVVIIGASVGTWVSFGARKFYIKFEDLASLEKDNMNPWLRLIYISVAALILMLFMSAGMFGINIGDIDTENVLTDIKSALTVGVLCGLVESKIGVNIYKKAVSIIGE